MKEVNCRRWRNSLGYSGCFMVDSHGKSGGLILLWKSSVCVCIKSYSPGHIDCIIQEPEFAWRFTGFYGQPDVSLRRFSWDLLRKLKRLPELGELPWLVGGDFNEICYDSEKLGGVRRSPSQMQEFRDAIEVCELQDIHSHGDLFTWVNRRQADSAIFERLDRYVACLKWRLKFPTARASSLEFYHSDHRPICIEVRSNATQNHLGRSKMRSLFRFEKYWLLEPECRDVITKGWGASDPYTPLMDRLSGCKLTLQKWASGRVSSIPKQLKSKRMELNHLRTSEHWKSSNSRIRSLEGEIEKLASQEEIYWRQRSRISWLREGDRNTRFFHQKSSIRKVQNSIQGLISCHGDLCTDRMEMGNIVLDYFGRLFSSSSPNIADLEAVVGILEPTVDSTMNQFLTAPFTPKEVHRALFDMNPDKAPGPDGFSALFYQKFWDVIGDNVTAAALQILNEGAPFNRWNETLVTLIPKVRDPKLMTEFRPISLCNVSYKIVSRAITNRFRPILSKIIGSLQSAFIPGRLITDNVIVGFEILHWLRNKRVGRSGYAALKLDMSKAYDRVEWDFLQALMNRLGFDSRWIALLMRCIRSVSYSFRVNQEVVGPLTPGRGLRQGDPLSSYLFVLCAQGLSALISSFESRGLIRGVKIATSSPSISHLFFADDSLVFFRATMEEGVWVRECLNTYERASGQTINFSKSALSFSPNTNPLVIDSIKTILTIPVVQRHDLYLGLPTVSMKSKKLQFNYLVERVVKRIQGWNHKCFSTGGKEVLIKSVLQSIPTYAMSCFKIPSQICDEIEKACANFWWGSSNGTRKMHWKSWDALCHPKCRGGMGFRKMTEFNRALLAKQFWRLIRDPDSLIFRVLKGRYFKHGDIMEAKLGNNPSYIWRSLIWSKDVMADGVLWRVGDGKNIRILEDNWIPSMRRKLGTSLVPCAQDLTVSSLIRDGVWDLELISNNFNTHVTSEILKIPLSTSGYKDARFLRYDPKGKYSVRDGYRLQRGMFDPPAQQSAFPNEDWWAFIWSLSLPPKIRIFWWQVSHDCITTNHNLWRHHVPVTGNCSLCGASCDSTCHSLFFCPVIRHLWKASQFAYVLKVANASHTMELCLWMKDKLLKSEFESFAIQTWAVWKERQSYIHRSTGQRLADNVDWSGVLLRDFHQVNKLNHSTALPRQPEAHRWNPPSFGFLKLNTDACVNKEADRYSIGGVLRDYQGRLLLAFGKRISQPISVVHGELLAVLEGLKLIAEKNFNNVLVETDSLLAVQAVAATQDDLGYVGICASEIGDRLRNLSNSEFSHVHRPANEVAHYLAQFASYARPAFVWTNGEFPCWLVQLVMDDISK